MAHDRTTEDISTDDRRRADDRPDVLLLGRAPRPVTGAELAARVRSALVEEVAGDLAEGAVEHLDRLRVSATVDGPDVLTLDVDLSGVVVRPTLSADGDATPTDERAAPVPADAAAREDGVLRRLRVDAHPVTMEGVPVDLVLEAQDVPFRWVEGTDGSLGVETVEPDDDAPLVGHVRVAAPQDALVATARRLVEEPLRTLGGLSLSSFDVEIESTGSRSARGTGFARVRKGILSASIHARASIEVDAAMVLTVRELSLTSRNPVVAAALLAARKHVDEAQGQTVDLAAELPAGIRLADVRLDVGESVAVSARFA
ncbi:hypothetical protein [Cellulosimicrobium sp. Marseille-Q4280]|uniref:hypothetical protein n=1 Tax=Cellulosimicrobium sp. Marseille-Q4280 TaxID=2937992 RepID=UPI00203A698B|nr:hypothetical protein [Cellulosimicrobium sp. Marseille-Q4280]